METATWAGVASQNQQGNDHQWILYHRQSNYLQGGGFITLLGGTVFWTRTQAANKAGGNGSSWYWFQFRRDLNRCMSVSCSKHVSSTWPSRGKKKKTHLFAFLDMLKQPQECTLKTMLHRHGRNVRKMADFSGAQGLICLWGFPCDASETFLIREIWLFFI